ncbi:MAG: transposase [Rectinemataceae bacterium]|nr:transposase [Rectinemataceae bacterium]
MYNRAAIQPMEGNCDMMGRQPPSQENLFYAGFSLDSRVRKDHPLRDVARDVDFNFICGEVGGMYGHNGNVSVPPPVILKLLFLLVTYNVRSERELMLTVPERLDWLWFLGYTLDSDIPNHSVLSKARRKWGADVFRSFFERIVFQCVERGLVDGKKLFVDSSLVEANASKNSVVDTQSLKRHLNSKYAELEKRLDEPGMGDGANRRYVSTTDPDSGHTRKGNGGFRQLLALEAVQERWSFVKAVSGRRNTQVAGERTAWERCGRMKNAIIQAWRSIINEAMLHLRMTLEANLV